MSLLAFAAGSVAWLVLRESRRAPLDTPLKMRFMRAETAPADKTVVVYYFHREQRCEACEKMEAYTSEAIQGGFAQLLGNRLIFRSENWEAPQNADLQKEYDIAFPTVVVVSSRGQWRKIEYKSNLLDDKQGFVRQVREAVAKAIEESP